MWNWRIRSRSREDTRGRRTTVRCGSSSSSSTTRTSDVAFSTGCSMSSKLTVLVVLVLMMFLSTVVHGDCPPNRDCGQFGVCVNDTRSCGNNCQERCKCQPDYFGFDCSFPAEICPDSVTAAGNPDTADDDGNEARECYNGGTCYQVEVITNTPGQGKLVWRCDCRHSYGTAAIYAGYQCEYPSDVSCEIDNPSSTYAFCVNGGTCVDMVESGQPHPGCHCPSAFQGRHCQYAFGKAPAQELLYVPQYGNDGLSTIALTFTILVSLLFVGTITCMAWRFHCQTMAKGAGKQWDDAKNGTPPNDLYLQEQMQGKDGEDDDDDEVNTFSPEKQHSTNNEIL